MRAVLLIVALVLSSACAAHRPGFAERNVDRRVVMTIVTWNVHVGRGDLDLLIDDLQSGVLTGRPVDDFVILLQEAIEGGAYDVMDTTRRRGLSTHFQPLQTSERGQSGNAIVSTRPLIDLQSIELPQVRRVRKAMAATIEVGGQRLRVTCAHLENRVRWLQGVLFFSENGRKNQAKALLAALPVGFGVLGGDLNTWLGPREAAWRTIMERFDDTPSESLKPTFGDRLVLDHLFFDLPDGWEATRDVVASRYGSDHHPVVGMILEKEPGSGLRAGADSVGERVQDHVDAEGVALR